MRKSLLVATLFVASLPALRGSAVAQVSDDAARNAEIRALQREIVQLEAELQQLKSALDRLKGGGAKSDPDPGTGAGTGAGTENEVGPELKAGEFLVPVTIGKRTWVPEVGALLFDLRYDFSALAKPARAVRGTLEIRDLFGVLKDSLEGTITTEIPVGGQHRSQLVNPSTWVRETDTKDMRVSFRVAQVLYTDGVIDEVQEFLVPVEITKKKWFARDQQLLFDLRCDFAALARPARSIQATLEFRDLFGALKHAVNYPLDRYVPAGGKYFGRGLWLAKPDGWLVDTSNKRMKVLLRVRQVLYMDGAIEEFQGGPATAAEPASRRDR